MTKLLFDGRRFNVNIRNRKQRGVVPSAKVEIGVSALDCRDDSVPLYRRPWQSDTNNGYRPVPTDSLAKRATGEVHDAWIEV